MPPYRPPKTAIVQTETFLSAEELFDLTGYKSARKQCEHLRAQGIAFIINARGYPRVSRAIFENHTKPKAKPPKTWQPPINTT